MRRHERTLVRRQHDHIPDLDARGFGRGVQIPNRTRKRVSNCDRSVGRDAGQLSAARRARHRIWTTGDWVCCLHRDGSVSSVSFDLSSMAKTHHPGSLRMRCS